MIPSDACSVRQLVKDPIALLASTVIDNYLLEKKSFEAKDTVRKESRKVSENNLVNAEHRDQDLKDTKHTLHGLGTKLGKVQDKTKSFKERVAFLEKKVSEQSNQLLAKDTVATKFQKIVVELKEAASLSLK